MPAIDVCRSNAASIANADDRALVFVIPPTPIARSGGVARTPETGQRRIYDVRACVAMPRHHGSRGAHLALEATWELTVEDVYAGEQTLAGRLAIRSLLLDTDLDVPNLAADLAPTHLVTFHRGKLTGVEAVSPIVIEIVTRLGLALGGVASASDSIQISLVALGG
jgi:hypothetical protein